MTANFGGEGEKEVKRVIKELLCETANRPFLSNQERSGKCAQQMLENKLKQIRNEN